MTVLSATDTAAGTSARLRASRVAVTTTGASSVGAASSRNSRWSAASVPDTRRVAGRYPIRRTLSSTGPAGTESWKRPEGSDQADSAVPGTNTCASATGSRERASTTLPDTTRCWAATGAADPAPSAISMRRTRRASARRAGREAIGITPSLSRRGRRERFGHPGGGMPPGRRPATPRARGRGRQLRGGAWA